MGKIKTSRTKYSNFIFIRFGIEKYTYTIDNQDSFIIYIYIAKKIVKSTHQYKKIERFSSELPTKIINQGRILNNINPFLIFTYIIIRNNIIFWKNDL